MKKQEIVLYSFIVIVLVSLIVLFIYMSKYDMTSKQNPVRDIQVDSLPTAKTQEQIEEDVIKKTSEYWSASQYKDFGKEYDLTEKSLRNRITREEYIRRKKWLQENTIAGLLHIDSFEFADISISDRRGALQTIFHTNIDDFFDTTYMIFEDGDWYKVFQSEELILPDESFDVFTKSNAANEN